jgi:hypothetical protein
MDPGLDSQKAAGLPFSDFVTLVQKGTVFDGIEDLYVYRARHSNVVVYRFRVSEFKNSLRINYVSTHLLDDDYSLTD